MYLLAERLFRKFMQSDKPKSGGKAVCPPAPEGDGAWEPWK